MASGSTNLGVFWLIFGGVWIALFGGFRSVAILLALAFITQFYFEGLFRTRLLPVFVLGCMLMAAVLLPMTEKLPITIQRSLSFLPLRLDPVARYAAEASTDWRLRMWREVMPEFPRYLLLGKGYAINPNELATVSDTIGRAGDTGEERAILVGDFHNGPLTLIVPLGIFGALGFLWFLGASFRVLLYNYRYGESRGAPDQFVFARIFYRSNDLLRGRFRDPFMENWPSSPA